MTNSDRPHLFRHSNFKRMKKNMKWSFRFGEHNRPGNLEIRITLRMMSSIALCAQKKNKRKITYYKYSAINPNCVCIRLCSFFLLLCVERDKYAQCCTNALRLQTAASVTILMSLYIRITGRTFVVFPYISKWHFLLCGILHTYVVADRRPQPTRYVEFESSTGWPAWVSTQNDAVVTCSTSSMHKAVLSKISCLLWENSTQGPCRYTLCGCTMNVMTRTDCRVESINKYK